MRNHAVIHFTVTAVSRRNRAVHVLVFNARGDYSCKSGL
jgi:hypothetical protein